MGAVRSLTASSSNMQDIYEEIEQCQLTANSTLGHVEPSFEHEYKYNLITTVDVPVPWRPDRDQQARGSGWLSNLWSNPQPVAGSYESDRSSLHVAVRFEMNQHGLLSFRVEEPEEHGDENSLSKVGLTMGCLSYEKIFHVVSIFSGWRRRYSTAVPSREICSWSAGESGVTLPFFRAVVGGRPTPVNRSVFCHQDLPRRRWIYY